MYIGTESYGQDGHIRNHGNGTNLYRGETFGQPRTLRPGDILFGGLVISDEPSDAGNGGVRLIFTDGSDRRVAARIPLQLESDTPGVLPADLQIGHILETGCVVLGEPRVLQGEEREDGESEIELYITGGWAGHRIPTPADLAPYIVKLTHLVLVRRLELLF